MNQADNRPREIVIYDNGAVLKILSFAEYVGGDHDPQFIVARNAILFFVALWAEAPGLQCRIVRVSGYGFHLRHAACCKLVSQIAHCVGELRKDQNLAVRVCGHEQIFQCAEFCIFLRLPCPELNEQVAQRFGVAHQVFAKVFNKMVRRHPAKSPSVCRGIECIDFSGSLAEIFFGSQHFRFADVFSLIVVLFLEDVARCAFHIFIIGMRIE